jgi:hypothetical protein
LTRFSFAIVLLILRSDKGSANFCWNLPLLSLMGELQDQKVVAGMTAPFRIARTSPLTQ